MKSEDRMMINTNFGANLSLITDAKTRSLSAENFTGEPGKGGMAETGTGASAARELGKGRKVSPSVMIEPGQTLVIGDIKGQGIIQSIWFDILFIV
jgi:hypothetical protein